MNKRLSTSVIIPSYNESLYLEMCLGALLAQTTPPNEIIVIDNASTDDSIKRAKKKFPTVTFLHEPKQGLVYARNTGFDYASGDILIKIDADTLALPQWLETLVADMIRHKADGWSGAINNIEINKWMQKTGSNAFNFFTFKVNRLVIGAPMLLGCNMALRKDAWNTIVGSLNMRNDIWEDLDISCEMKKCGLKVINNSKKLATISARSANTSLVTFVRRMHGQSRVYKIRKLWPQYAMSLIFLVFETLTWILLAPLSSIGKKITRRPRPEQY